MSESTSPRARVELSGTASLKGKVSYAKGNQKPIYTFLGVPYAQPPTGHLRFAPPAQLKLWEGERAALEFGATCPHVLDMYKIIPKSVTITRLPTNLSEDCLFANIWTPTLDPAARLPVMFWIHGGGFGSGNGDVYEGTSLATFEDVVFVSINYRLGAFGFLSTGDDVARGNFGLLDQIEGLHWMQKYIHKFGGDPSNVTIFGESAGGISVSILMHSPLTEGLFRRAICQSGTLLTPNHLLNAGKQAASLRTKAQVTDCKSTKSEDMVAYLRSLTAEELMKTLPIEFKPVMDGHVIRDSSFKLYKQFRESAASSDCTALGADYLLGHNSHEGALVVGVLLVITGTKLTKREDITDYIRNVLKPCAGAQDVETLAAEATDLYFEGANYDDEEELKERLVNFHGDFLMVAPTEESASLHSERSKTYVYCFDHRPSSFDQFDVPKWVKSDHISEIVFALGLPFSDDKLPDFTPEEEKLSQLMMKYWANFARTGDPNGATSSPKWSQFSQRKPQRMVLNKSPKMASSLEEAAPSCTPARLAFLRQFMPGCTH